MEYPRDRPGSEMGELCFGAHGRHAEREMHILADDVLARVGDHPGTAELRLLLERAATVVV